MDNRIERGLNFFGADSRMKNRVGKFCEDNDNLFNKISCHAYGRFREEEIDRKIRAYAEHINKRFERRFVSRDSEQKTELSVVKLANKVVYTALALLDRDLDNEVNDPIYQFYACDFGIESEEFERVIDYIVEKYGKIDNITFRKDVDCLLFSLDK